MLSKIDKRLEDDRNIGYIASESLLEMDEEFSDALEECFGEPCDDYSDMDDDEFEDDEFDDDDDEVEVYFYDEEEPVDECGKACESFTDELNSTFDDTLESFMSLQKVLESDEYDDEDEVDDDDLDDDEYEDYDEGEYIDNETEEEEDEAEECDGKSCESFVNEFLNDVIFDEDIE